MPRPQTGNSQSPADPRADISNFPDRFRLEYHGLPNGTYEVQRGNGSRLFDLDQALLGTDPDPNAQPPLLDPNYVPQRIECRQRINPSDGTKRVEDYECDYRNSAGNTRTIRLADMAFVAFVNPAAGQPTNGYYPPA
jgi:hypothetical protein